MGLLYRGNDIAAGGQVYDRTTGTWQGETKGSFGDGINHGYSDSGYDTKVWRDAEGITGVQLIHPQGNSDRAGSGAASSQVASNATSDNGGTGVGVGTVKTSGPGSAGKGAGSSMVVMGGPLKNSMKDKNTSLMVGGYVEANPMFSDADEYTARWGEGEVAETIYFLVNASADAWHNGKRFVNYVQSEAPTWNGATPSRINEPTPIYSDGWVSYDESQTWEKAPKGSLADQYWSF